MKTINLEISENCEEYFSITHTKPWCVYKTFRLIIAYFLNIHVWSYLLIARKYNDFQYLIIFDTFYPLNWMYVFMKSASER